MVGELMSGEFAELFQELLFGVESGGIIIGLGIILSMAYVVTWKVKYVGIFWGMLLVFLGMEYAERLSGSSRYMWAVAICFVSAVFCILKVVYDAKEH